MGAVPSALVPMRLPVTVLLAVPVPVVEVIRRSLARLPAATAGLLAVAAVLGAGGAVAPSAVDPPMGADLDLQDEAVVGAGEGREGLSAIRTPLLLGGEFSAGPRDGNGFQVSARLPYPAVAP